MTEPPAKALRVGIVGATGYTAVELIRLLLRHPHVELTRLTSRGEAGQPVDAVHPSLRGRLDLRIEGYSADQFASNVDCAFCCLPHGASSPVVSELAGRGLRVIDFSADYRLDSEASFRDVYATEHADPGRLGKVPYGLPELFRESIRRAEVVANPGCFPTSAILALAPLLANGLIEPRDIIVDSKTGVSGGGRTPKLPFHFPECNESVSAYAVGTHRHGPEIAQILGRLNGETPEVLFVPHLIPMTRGILSTVYCRPAPGSGAAEIAECLKSHYVDEPFVRLADALPGTGDVSGTNYCDLAVRPAGNRVAVISVIDNLVKGASGAAVQNMNLMFGFPETTALI